MASLQGSKIGQERKPSLTRSQTDSNITYSGEEIPEASGSTFYITKDGDIDLQVVLKVCFLLIQKIYFIINIFCSNLNLCIYKYII